MMISASIVHLRLRQIFYRNRSSKKTTMEYDELPSPPPGNIYVMNREEQVMMFTKIGYQQRV